jgi:hypothetical protein
LSLLPIHLQYCDLDNFHMVFTGLIHCQLSD